MSVTVQIEIQLPEYKIKYCDDDTTGRCIYLHYYDYGFKAECLLSLKRIKFNPNTNWNRAHRPYGCRCLAKQYEEKEK